MSSLALMSFLASVTRCLDSFFNIWSTENLPYTKNIFANTKLTLNRYPFNFLTKWQIFLKSGHAEVGFDVVYDVVDAIGVDGIVAVVKVSRCRLIK